MKIFVLNPIKNIINSEFKNSLKDYNVEYVYIPSNLNKISSMQTKEEKILVIDPDFTVELTQTVLAKIPNIKCIILSTTSFDWIDLDFCSANNIAVCNTPYFSDEVIDYTKEDFTKRTNAYDIIYDTVWKSSYQKCKHSLMPTGMYMTSGPSLAIVIAFLTTRFTKQKAVTGATGPFWKQTEMEYIADLAEQSMLTPITDSTYPFTQAGITQAHELVETGHKVGSVVVEL